jgi:hypothetical protein
MAVFPSPTFQRFDAERVGGSRIIEFSFVGRFISQPREYRFASHSEIMDSNFNSSMRFLGFHLMMLL